MVTLADARRVIAAAEKKAAEIGQPMNIAVADGGGNIIAHVGIANVWIGSIDISHRVVSQSEALALIRGVIRWFQALIETMLHQLLMAAFFQDVVLIEILYFQFHGEGRPPCTSSTGFGNGSVWSKGRMSSLPVPA